ncbi:MAG: molybdopterin synthase sulfur carrier subunit [Gimesia sp.]|uniref:Molybdopterin synthase sulfur carrier subunit n=1 Tax=Gimesia maris TaxID=122 RepID=A0A3D3R564_9PLAN|nr:molybdopterin synthase sulfur carrier subunit [Gimesia sp.]HCO23157.1 molybdopterin synthase sulfur carrier subunit [Gimesia maris]|tara:strand:+ start:59027 stop:59281 length:255 start_codon:yes stop_codon:yes gene_type:complete
MTVQQIQVRLFARARELANSDLIWVEVGEGTTVACLRQAIAEQVPQLQPLSGKLLIAVDNAYAGEDELLSASQEVACFPPVSGG